MTERRKYPKVKFRTPELDLIMELWEAIEYDVLHSQAPQQAERLRGLVEKMLAGVPRCDDPGCRGWFTNNETGRVERCDACARYPHDESARQAANRSGMVED